MSAPRSARRAALTCLAMAGAGWAVLGSSTVFPHLSDNNDEAVYLLQADALLHGELFPPAPTPTEAFLPWMTRSSGDHFVPKYTPIHSGFIALSDLVTGSPRFALGFIAAGTIVATYRLAAEVLQRSGLAMVASLLLALSPTFLIQSLTFLPYLSNLALLQAFVAAFLRGVGRRSKGAWRLAGLLLGLAAFARPYDAALFLLPLGAWWSYVRRGDRRTWRREAGWLLTGAAVPLLLMAAYLRAATGSPFRLPFTWVGGSDTLGFGPRGPLEMAPLLPFTPLRALEGLWRHALLTGWWSFGGPILVVLAVSGWRRGRRGPALPLVLTGLAVPAGYVFFWGSYGALAWGGPGRLGPYYHLPVLVPLAVLGAAGLARLWDGARNVAVVTGCCMVGLSGLVFGRALAANRPFTEERQRLFAPLVAARLDEAVVFLPPLQGPWLLQPFALARNAPHYDGPVIWALDRGATANAAVLDSFPGRVAYLLRHEGRRGATPPDLDFTTRLERLERLGEGTGPALGASAGGPPATGGSS